MLHRDVNHELITYKWGHQKSFVLRVSQELKDI
jgi:hypothetical protein